MAMVIWSLECTTAWTYDVRSERFKPLLFLICLYPVFRWVVLAYGPDGLGANPPEYLIRSTGVWSLVLLCITLCVTPVRKMLDRPELIRFRRMLGLFSFFYGMLHVLGWALWEHGWSMASMAADIIQRTFVWVGVLAFVPMLLLALTSTQGWMRRLGRRWKQLHFSIHAIAILSVWHFWLVRGGKVDYREPLVYAAMLLLIYGVRLALKLRRVHGA